MEARGEIKDITIDYRNKQTVVAFEFEGKKPELFEAIVGKKLRIKIVEWREKRSRNANDYFHALNRQLANKLGISEPKCKNIILRRYGCYEIVDGRLFSVVINDRNSEAVDEFEHTHLYPTSDVKVMADGEIYRKYYMLRGSHTYNTKEMSVLLDGLISECAEQGIDTCTDSEKQNMLERWAGHE